MTWFKIDDGFWGNPKRMACTADAIGLWTVAGSWCSHQLTDGEVPKHVLPILGGTTRLAQKLVDAGLWDKTETGWRFHDWDDYQPTRPEVEERRRKRAEAGARGGRASGQARRRSNDEASASPNAEATSEANANPSAEATPNPVPSRPVPTVVPNGTTNNGSLRSPSPSAAKRGSRLPDNWQPSTQLVDQMRQECPGVDLRAEHRVFADYWAAQPGQKGVKADWDATWRNWMRKAVAGSTQTARTRPSTTDAGIAAIQAMKHPQRLEIA